MKMKWTSRESRSSLATATAQRTARALASAILQVLSNREVVAGMGAAGRRRALEHFGFDRYVHEYESLYAHLHAASARGEAHAHS